MAYGLKACSCHPLKVKWHDDCSFLHVDEMAKDLNRLKFQLKCNNWKWFLHWRAWCSVKHKHSREGLGIVLFSSNSAKFVIAFRIL